MILPGVGTFGAASTEVAEKNWIEILRDRVAAERPTLAICVGMQLLCASSEESPFATGLGIIRETIRRFPQDAVTPHLGWNRIEPFASELLEPGEAYFANSYRLERPPAGWGGSMSTYEGLFVSALERGAVLACQFHPELSGDYGARLLDRWLDRGNSA